MENNQVQVFNNSQFGDVRVIMQGEQPWFVGKDVASVLGYSNSRDALNKHVDEEDKGGSKLRHPWRKTKSNYYQRIWLVFSHYVQQAPKC